MRNLRSTSQALNQGLVLRSLTKVAPAQRHYPLPISSSRHCLLSFSSSTCRAFGTSPALLKRDPKGNNRHPQSPPAVPTKAKADVEADGSGAKYPQPEPTAPLDFTEVASRWKALSTHYVDGLKIVSARSKLAPAMINKLMVKIPVAKEEPVATSTKRAAKAAKAAATPDHTEVPLSELAQVVEGKGRLVVLSAHDVSYVKPIMSAIQNSDDYNQQPQPGATELELVLKTELQTPEEMSRRVKDMCVIWRTRVREVSAKRSKIHKTWKSERTVLVDDFKKAEDQLKKLQDKEMADIDKHEAAAIKKIESGKF